MKTTTLITSLLMLFLSINTFAQKPQVERVEPPNWWAGMHNNSLELLVYGKDIGHLKPQIQYQNIVLKSTTRVENENYLFLNLELNGATAGTFTIRFMDKEKLVLSQKYELKARDKDIAEHTKGFDNSDVLYLITPDRFANGDASNDNVAGLTEQANRDFKGGRHGGDIEGMRQKLDYISDMGFTAIWVNPVLENNMEEYSYHGYSTTDFYKVDPRFGTNESYKQLAKEARKKGISLIMDMIVNHCGSEHWWMNDLPTNDWINTWEEYTETSHRKTIIQDPYASSLDKKIFTDGWFVKTMPDLNQRNPNMATYLTQNGIWWIEYLGLAGIRMDTYPYPDMDYMTEWTRRVMEEYPNFNVVGEEWTTEQSLVSYWQRGKENTNGYTSQLPSLMDFPLQDGLVQGLTEEESWGKGWITLYQTLAQDFLYADPNNLVVFPDNHDMSRFYRQVNEDYDLFKMGMVYTLTTRGIPQLYYGTEILMTSPKDRDDGIIRSDFPGGWEGDTINAVTGEGLTNLQKEAQSFLKKLLNWRKTATAVQTGKLIHFVPKEGVYVFFRYDDNQKIMVVLNKNNESYSLDLQRFAEQIGTSTIAEDILTGTTISLQTPISFTQKGAMILELK